MNRFVRVTLFLCWNKKNTKNSFTHLFNQSSHKYEFQFDLHGLVLYIRLFLLQMAFSAQSFNKRDSLNKEVFDDLQIYLLAHDSVPQSIL